VDLGGPLPPNKVGAARGLAGRAPLAVLLVGLCGAEPLETGILSLANGIVQVELSSEMPLAIDGVLATNVVRVECEGCLVWGHMRHLRVEKLHGEIKPIGVGR